MQGVLAWAVRLILVTLLEWLFGKVKAYAKQKSMEQEQRETIRKLTAALKKAETEEERRRVTEDLASGSF